MIPSYLKYQQVQMRMGCLKYLQVFTDIIDDEIDEFEQRFILVAEIGSDVPDSFVCFQRQATGDTGCMGRAGATEIKIVDNDGEYLNNRTSLLLHFSLLCIVLQF